MIFMQIVCKLGQEKKSPDADDGEDRRLHSLEPACPDRVVCLLIVYKCD